MATVAEEHAPQRWHHDLIDIARAFVADAEPHEAMLGTALPEGLMLALRHVRIV